MPTLLGSLIMELRSLLKYLFFQHLEEEREKKIQSYEEHIVRKMATMAQLSSDDVQQFMEEHRKDMDLYNG